MWSRCSVIWQRISLIAFYKWVSIYFYTCFFCCCWITMKHKSCKIIHDCIPGVQCSNTKSPHRYLLSYTNDPNFPSLAHLRSVSVAGFFPCFLWITVADRVASISVYLFKAPYLPPGWPLSSRGPCPIIIVFPSLAYFSHPMPIFQLKTSSLALHLCCLWAFLSSYNFITPHVYMREIIYIYSVSLCKFT